MQKIDIKMIFACARRLVLAAIAFLMVTSAQAQHRASPTFGPAQKPLTIPELHSHVEGAITSVLLHEAGHAIIDIYDVPVLGEEEEVADQFATILLFEQAVYGRTGRQLADSFFNFVTSTLDALQKDPYGNLIPGRLFDTHDISARRGFKILCDMYGAFSLGIKQGNQELVRARDYYGAKLREISQSSKRVEQCQSGYARNFLAWRQLLMHTFRPKSVRAAILQDSAATGAAKLPGEPVFRVTYAPKRDPAGLMQRIGFDRMRAMFDGDSIRYDLPARIARVLTARFKLPSKDRDGRPTGSVDIFVRNCGVANAFYNRALRSITLCHELIDKTVDTYIQHRTGRDPTAWWFQPVEEKERVDQSVMTGTWKSSAGLKLHLGPTGEFAIEDVKVASSRREGFWGTENGTLWLIPVTHHAPEPTKLTTSSGREIVLKGRAPRVSAACFNPACPDTRQRMATLLPFEAEELSRS
ncbi:MAG: DUF4344 domain-containing metallopeptidase, partial [Alphaproteobacteria bacterium]|nr:DUF4344 domain-containing metallopeptidase [Alphaproteobacteria bacterium]